MRLECWELQRLFVNAAMSGRLRHVLAIGGYGAGKTWVGAATCWGLAITRPKSKGVIASGTYRQLKDTVLDEFFNVGKQHGLDKKIANWNKTDLCLTLKNGAEILFRSMEIPSRLLSLTLHWYWVDQLESARQESFDALDSRLRGIYPDFLTARMNNIRNVGIMTMNPAPGSWIEDIYKKFGTVDELPNARMSKYGLLTLGPHRSHSLTIRMPSYANKSLPKDYVYTLARKYGGPKSPYYQRLIEGRDTPLSGQVYPMYDYEEHTCDPFRIPIEWEKWAAIDFGYENPFCYLAFALSPDGTVYVCGEIYQRHLTNRQQARLIKEQEALLAYDIGNHLVERERYADHDATERANLNEEGIDTSPARKEITNGIMSVVSALSPRPGGRKPRLQIFRTCANLLREIRDYRYNPKARGDVPMKAATGKWEDGTPFGDHAMDALRYGIHSHLGKSQLAKLEIEERTDRYPFEGR